MKVTSGAGTLGRETMDRETMGGKTPGEEMPYLLLDSSYLPLDSFLPSQPCCSGCRGSLDYPSDCPPLDCPPLPLRVYPTCCSP